MPWKLADRTLELERPIAAGIVNVTADSMFEGARSVTPEQAVADGLALAEAGFEMLDVGAVAARSGPPVGAEEEAAALVPAIAGLTESFAVCRPQDYKQPTLPSGDSMFEGARSGTAEQAIADGLKLAEAGFDMLDVGAVAARSGPAVDPADEAARAIPAIEGLVPSGVPISADTFSVAVARRGSPRGRSRSTTSPAARRRCSSWSPRAAAATC